MEDLGRELVLENKQKELNAKKLNSENENNILGVSGGSSGERRIDKYLREDCEEGCICDSNEIHEYKRIQRIDTLRNALLGSYAADGAYSISESIRLELRKAKKVTTSQHDNYVFLETIFPIVGFDKVRFHVVVARASQSELVATLHCDEPVDKVNGFVTNTQSSLIASFSGKAQGSFYFDMKEYFNILPEDSVEVDTLEEDKFYESLKMKMSRKMLWQESIADIEAMEKEIFEKRLEVLKKHKNQQFVKDLLALFDQEKAKVSKPFIDKSPTKYTDMNAMLDACFERVKTEETKEIAQTIHKEFIESTMEVTTREEQKIGENKNKVADEINKTFGGSFGGGGAPKAPERVAGSSGGSAQAPSNTPAEIAGSAAARGGLEVMEEINQSDQSIRENVPEMEF